MRRRNLVETSLQDVRYGLRQMRRSPGFTAVAVLTLAAGIGATTAIFSVVDAVLLRPVPYPKPAELVEITENSPQTAAGEINEVSPGDFTDWQQQASAFEGIAAYDRMEFHALTGGGEPDEVWASAVTPNLFRVLGVNAAWGRTFAPGETQVVVLSHQYWVSHFSSDRGIVGKALALDGKTYTVIGIAPAALEFPAANSQMWVPLTFSAAERADHEDRRLSVIARLRPGVTLQQAQAEMDTVARRLEALYPKTNAGWRAPVTAYKGPEVRDVLREAIFALLGAVVFMLMIVCSNVASMLLARGTTREGEMAIRAALGAGRHRLVRQLLVESVLLAVAAAAGGLVLAHWALGLIVNLVPKYNLIETQALRQISMNFAAFGFGAVVAVLTGIGAAGFARRPQRVAQGTRTHLDGWARGASAAAAGGLRGRARPGAAGRRRPDDSELPAAGRGSHRIRSRSSPDRSRPPLELQVFAGPAVGGLLSRGITENPGHTRRQGGSHGE